MGLQFKKLSKDIEINGVTEEYKNGENPFGRKKSTSADVYDIMIKSYITAQKQLNDLNYHKNFKIGKKYVRGDSRCLRVFNSARQAHLIEYGHANYNKHGEPNEFTLGKYVFKEAELEFESQFKDDAEKFLFQYFDKTTE